MRSRRGGTNVQRLAALVAIVLSACATADEPSMLIVRGESSVEQQILRSYQTYSSVNASVGGPIVEYTTDRTNDLSSYGTIIRQRMQRDLAELYDGPVQRADRVYLLLGVVGGRDVVQVIRLGASDPNRPNRQSFDGLYQVGPLTYVFDPTSHAVLSVSGPVAGEY